MNHAVFRFIGIAAALSCFGTLVGSVGCVTTPHVPQARVDVETAPKWTNLHGITFSTGVPPFEGSTNPSPELLNSARSRLGAAMFETGLFGPTYLGANWRNGEYYLCGRIEEFTISVDTNSLRGKLPKWMLDLANAKTSEQLKDLELNKDSTRLIVHCLMQLDFIHARQSNTVAISIGEFSATNTLRRLAIDLSGLELGKDTGPQSGSPSANIHFQSLAIQAALNQSLKKLLPQIDAALARKLRSVASVPAPPSPPQVPKPPPAEPGSPSVPVEPSPAPVQSQSPALLTVVPDVGPTSPADSTHFATGPEQSKALETTRLPSVLIPADSPVKTSPRISTWSKVVSGVIILALGASLLWTRKQAASR